MAFPIAWILNELGQKMYAWASTKSVMDFDRGGENGQTLQKTLNDLFSSVSEGKSLIAAAVTEKGVETAADSTFQEMANNIKNLPNGLEWIHYQGASTYAPPTSIYSLISIPVDPSIKGVLVYSNFSDDTEYFYNTIFLRPYNKDIMNNTFEEGTKVIGVNFPFTSSSDSLSSALINVTNGKLNFYYDDMVGDYIYYAYIK